NSEVLFQNGNKRLSDEALVAIILMIAESKPGVVQEEIPVLKRKK
ncbi:MAG: hypothetical protein HXM92_08225, partial [Oribacterium parvum]|nr:hypothetical protein [Oribacterium parvum]